MKSSASCDRASLEPRALALRLLSTAFLQPDEGWKERLLARLGEAGGRFRPLRAALADASAEGLAAEHSRLFGSDPDCPLELAFHLSDNPFEQARRMAELAGFHKAFGVEAQDGVRPDHLPVCLEFLAYLHVKLAHAAGKGLKEARGTTEKALVSYARDLLVPGLRGFSKKLRERAGGAFYRALTRMTLKEVESCLSQSF